ncbi:MAG: COX15/CtaA family protein [Chloroflexota bacterium]
MKKTRSPLAKFSWIIVIYTIFIILWGAVVRATGSGAGCGSHWPTCHGEIIPRPEAMETIIEFTHRLTSAILGPLIIGMLVWCWRSLGRRAAATKAAIWSLVLVIVEGGLGAGLVLFELVSDEDSLASGLAMGIHLINTLLLLGAISLTAWYASGYAAPSLWAPNTRQLRWALGIGLAGLLLVSAFGAVTALGDTLFPADSFLEGAAAKFEPNAHFAVKMRTWHPTVAVAVSLYITILVYTVETFWRTTTLKWLARFNLAIIIIQILGGFVNVLLAAPIWMQLVHLALADLAWMAFLLIGVEGLSQKEQAQAEVEVLLEPSPAH